MFFERWWLVPLKLAALSAAAVTALTVGITVPIWVSQLQDQEQVLPPVQALGPFLASGGLFNIQTPVNDMQIPVNGSNLRDDQCGDGLVRYRDGNCYPVLRRGPCTNPLQWLTVDPITLSVKQVYIFKIYRNTIY